MKKWFACVLCLGIIPGMLSATSRQLTVVSGEASLQQLQDTFRLTVSDKAILEWKTFSIGEKEHFHFHLPNENAKVLNRVTTSSVSTLLGKLTSNGSIFLINPAGILIGNNALIDCNSLVLSTLDLSNDSFLHSDTLSFEKGKGSIVNNGKIFLKKGGTFLAPHIVNHGSITANEGLVFLATQKAYLQTEEKTFFIEQETNVKGILHDGVIESPEVQFVSASNPFEAAIRLEDKQQGTSIRAIGGRVFLIAEKSSIAISGSIDTSDSQGTGGEISIIGKEIRMRSDAFFNASGATGGGTVLLGDHPSYPLAERLTVESGALIQVNATERGTGGTVRMNSSEATRFFGRVEAKGLGEADGGLFKLSGQKKIDSQWNLSCASEKGLAGELIFDPHTITIAAGGGATIGQVSAFATDAATDRTIAGSTIATTLNAGTAVTLQANTDILAQDTITATTGTANLTFQAGRTIAFSSTGLITLVGGSFSATINDNGATTDRDAGTAQFTFPTTASISTGGGNITITHQSNTGGNVGEIQLTGGNLQAGGGNISITGDGTQATVSGIRISAGEITTSGTGTITITGTGPSGSVAYGIHQSDATVRTSGSGLITMTGTGQNTGASVYGIFFNNGTVTSTSGSITLNGTSGAGTSDCNGVNIAGTTFTASLGTLTINGTSRGTTTGNNGITFGAGATPAVNVLQIALLGTNTVGTGTSTGVNIPDRQINTGATTSTITGTSGATSGASNRGVLLNNCTLTSTGGGFTLNGTGGLGASTDSYGVHITGATVTQTSGLLSIAGTGRSTTGSGNAGITIGTATLSAQSISCLGIGGAGVNTCSGVAITGSTITTTTGNSTITGFGAGTGTDGYGVSFGTSSLTATIGDILITATSSAGTNSCFGFFPASGTLSSTGGRLTVVAISDGTGSDCLGINAQNMTLINGSTGLFFTGTGGTGTNADGIEFSGAHTITSASNIALTGTGRGTTSTRGVHLFGNGAITITSTGGNITARGTGGPATGADSDGLLITNSTWTAPSTGTIFLFGTSNGTGSTALGINVQSSVTLNGGSITMEGTAGAGTTFCRGTSLASTVTATASTGNMTITGTGNGTTTNEQGVFIGNVTTLAATLGNITITGTGSTGTDTNQGILIGETAASSLTANSGTITLTGTGRGTGTANLGVDIQVATVISGGTVAMTGVGSASGTSVNRGVRLLDDCRVTATTGNLTLTGTGRGSTLDNQGVYLENGPTTPLNTLTATLGNIILTGTSQGLTTANQGVFLTNASRVVATAGSITITGTGSTSGTTTCQGIFIGTTAASTLTANSGTITFIGTAGGSAGTNLGIDIVTSTVISGGSIAMTGTGSGTDTGRGVSIKDTSTVTATTGNIIFTGTGGGSTTDNQGVYFENGVTCTATVGGITMTGTGSAGTSSNDGITTATGGGTGITFTASAGTITLAGTARGTTSSNIGINLQSLTATSLRAVLTGSANAGTSGCDGISLSSSTLTTTTGGASLTGTTAGSTTGNQGIAILSSTLSATSGAIAFTGTVSAGTNDVQGVFINAGSSITATTGGISIVGSSAGSGTTAYGMWHQGTLIRSTSGFVDVQSTRNELRIESPVTATNGNLRLLALSLGTNIDCLTSGNLTAGGDTLIGANDTVTLGTGLLIASTRDITIIVDQRNPHTVGTGQFVNAATLTTGTGNIAVYAASGPVFPSSFSPGPNLVTFGSLNASNIATWDASLPPLLLASKYFTSYSDGGPIHGGGFGSNYTPGNGVFGSIVVWYKYPFLMNSHLNDALQLFQINWNVAMNYFFYPEPMFSRFHRTYPCVSINDCTNYFPMP